MKQIALAMLLGVSAAHHHRHGHWSNPTLIQSGRNHHGTTFIMTDINSNEELHQVEQNSVAGQSGAFKVSVDNVNLDQAVGLFQTVFDD